MPGYLVELISRIRNQKSGSVGLQGDVLTLGRGEGAPPSLCLPFAVSLLFLYNSVIRKLFFMNAGEAIASLFPWSGGSR